ncbi:integrase [Polaribacter phage Leef_1]|uniref:Integrase n=1 Tax=Polaribacter phage Leef_1 TaxID=2745684 RepID=A0A8E5EA25_9CAUD|nr:integrase [Polaribacter phage Leef_1]QQV91403.1 integrase [Polaribacter phage Leef_1]
MKKYIEDYQNYLKMLGLAPRTITIYSSIITKFLEAHPEPGAITKSQLVAFMVQRGAARTIKQTHGALNHFFIGILNSNAIKKIPQPKVSEFIPNILSEIEMQQVIRSITNLKHEAIIQLIYSCALRVGECINLKVTDIDKTKNIIKIVNGKGGKDAYIPIPAATKNLLRVYYQKYKPKLFLFEGQSSPKYSASSIRKVLNNALNEANIRKKIRVHDLRHSRATHWLDNGMDIKFIQKILRHKKSETTDRYLHLATESLERAMLFADKTIQKRFQLKELHPTPLLTAV